MSTTSTAKTMWVGVGLLAVLAGAVYIALTASTGLPGQRHSFVNASFSSVGDLRVGDDVREASVRIGQVRSIELKGDRAVVELQLDPDQKVYRDATAEVSSRSALGQNFVELTQGTRRTGQITANDMITESRTTPPAALDQVLDTFDAKTRNATRGLLQQVGGGLDGQSQALQDFLTQAPVVLPDLGTVSRAAAAPQTNLAGLLVNTDTLASRFRGRSATVAELTKNLGTTLAALDSGKGADASAIGQTLDEAPATLSSARRALVALRSPLADLQAGMRTLSPGARALGASEANLEGTLDDVVSPLDKVPGVARTAAPAVTSLTHLLADARPLSPEVEALLNSARTPTAVLAPYAPEIARFFTYWDSANRPSDKSGHYLRIDLVVRPESADGILGIRDPFVHRDPYPAPGKASQERATTILGGNGR
ncbi:MAG: hypothetical protein JWP74_3180 [Marmoricola sp.]|nr:hypothetical protein [Marmoricola sp.]